MHPAHGWINQRQFSRNIVLLTLFPRKLEETAHMRSQSQMSTLNVRYFKFTSRRDIEVFDRPRRHFAAATC